MNLIELCKNENYVYGQDSIQEWEVRKYKNGSYKVIVDDKDFPLLHPLEIHLRLYRDAVDPVEKLHSMRRIHDFLWPDHIITWNYWTERRFEAHCSGYKVITMAGGAGCGKSLDAAKLAIIFWLSDPRRNACIVASTTLESLESRIWGYVAKFLTAAALPLDYKILRSKPPKVMCNGQADRIHGMFAVAVKQGDDDNVLGTIIGRHPDKRLLIILDEATDMNPAITKAIPNLEQGVDMFQLWAIGNSNSRNDLHGALSTPKRGWDKLDPTKDYIWETEQEKGICLYFNPYDSPAIHEANPVKKEALSKFLITEHGIETKKGKYGEKSDSYWRFVMGFWQMQNIENTILGELFLQENHVYSSAEWSGFYPLQIVAGLDPAFQVGGTGCALRLGVLGQETSGKIVLDYRGDELLFKIDLQIDEDLSGEIQIAEQVCAILEKYKCRVGALTLDATGVGRALGGLIKIVSKQNEEPFRMVSVRPSVKKGDTDPHIVVTSPSEMWLKFRTFVEEGSIRGIDHLTAAQLTNRLVTLKNKKLILESKGEYKDRMLAINPSLARSPDESDAMILCLHSAMYRYGFTPGQRRAVVAQDFATQKMQAMRALQGRGEFMVQDSRASRPVITADFKSPLEEFARSMPESFSAKPFVRIV